MFFELSDEQKAIVEMAENFGNQQILPSALRWERDGTIPRDFLKEVGKLGLGGIYVSPEYGGSGLGRTDAVLIFEALSKACPSIAAFISIHNMCAWMIDRFASQHNKEKLLADICSFEKVVSYCLTEPGSGSDAAALRTKAELVGDQYILNGTKAFISGGNYSDIYIVMCRTGEAGSKGISAFLVEKGTDGLCFGASEHKMGWRAQPTAQLQFDDCKIPQENLLGEIGQGFKYAMRGLDGGRLNIAACSLGGAQSTLDRAIQYMSERKAFGQTLDQFQALQFKLADMEINLQAARSLLHKSADKLENKSPDATKFCAMAKSFVTDKASQVADQALQLHGGYGYLEDYGIEKIVRDIRVHRILEGTNEIMHLIVSRHLVEEAKA